MKSGYLFALMVFISLAFTQDHYSLPVDHGKFKLPAGITAKDYLPNTLVLKFKNNARQNTMSKGTQIALAKRDIAIALSPIFTSPDDQDQPQKTLKNGVNFSNYFYAKYTGRASIEEVITILLTNENVEYAEPSYIHYTSHTPNDPAFGVQFYLPQVKAPEAWEVLRNSSSVIIGIVDSGSELNHEDLAANIYYNKADPLNGVDDDGDGYVDNYAGWDFCGASASTMIADNDPNVKNKASDHGVHVSGIAGAVSNNGIGVASVAYNPKLLIIKAGADDNADAIYKGYEGIKYAVDKGATIINCSWGGVGGGQFGQDMVNYAISKGCLVVAAAGNSANDVAIYPAAFEGVFAVGNLEKNDKKGEFSNYGTYVDISAPGQSIYSTVFNNGYAYYSGTSMAAPLVASAAALLKAKYPMYTGLQIGELLRATADNIDAVNPTYVNLLGGRLNIYRALTEAAVSVRYQNIKLIDQSAGNRAPGTEMEIQLSIKNFLNPVSNLKVNLSSNSRFIQILQPQIDAGNFSSLEVKTLLTKFNVKISANTPINHEVIFTLKYVGNNGAYTDFENFGSTVALDYLNVEVNKISTTLTSNGRVGYSKNGATGGLGFVYKEESMLFEAALLVGQSETQVMNNARINAETSEDFIRKRTAAMVLPSYATFEGTSEFTDNGATNPIGLSILSRMLAFNTTGDEKYVIVEYELTNTSNADLKGIYTGLFTDWDLDESSANATKYDATSGMAYAYAKKNVGYPYAGVKLLAPTAAPSYYPLSYQLPNSFLTDNEFTVAEKYKTLASGIQAVGLGHDVASGYDIMFTLGSGPYNIDKGKMIKVAYSFLAGDDLSDLLKVAEASRVKYTAVVEQSATTSPVVYALGQNFPNAAKSKTTIAVSIPEKTNVQLTIYDMLGRKVKQINNSILEAGVYKFDVDVSRFTKGIYSYELKTPTYRTSKKMIVTK